MPQTRFITSEAQIGAPGVYVLEQAPASPVQGQRRRIAGFVGQCVRGPVDIAVLCTSYTRFTDVFGLRDKNSNGGTILGHVWKALQGKRWGKFYVVRVAAAAAVKASFTLESATGGGGTAIARLDATSPGTWGNDVQWKVLPATNADANYWNLAIKLYGVVTLYQNITTQATGMDNTNQVVGNDYATLVKIVKLADGRPSNSVASTDGADTDGYTKLGQTVAAYVSVAGTDGSIADTDYTATGRGIQVLNATRGVHACAVVGRSNVTVKTAIKAMIITQRVWFIAPDDQTVLIGAAVTERATFATDRLSYWYNHLYFLDPITLETILEEPFLGVMSVITQTDPDIHPGQYDNAPLWNYSTGVYASLGDPDRDTLDAAGISFMNLDLDAAGNQIVIAGNALTCDFADNNRDLDARYEKDFLLDAIANRLRADQFKGNTKANRASRAAAIGGFLTTLARKNRYVNKDEQSGAPLFSYKNDSSVNSTQQQQSGLQTEKLICQLIAKNKILLLLAVIGVDASVTEVAA